MLKFTLVMMIFVYLICETHSNQMGWGRIFHGSNAPFGRYPFVVSLQEKGIKASSCGGTLLSSKLIITAAHCIVHPYWEGMIAVAGTVNAENWGKGHQTANIVKVIQSGPFPVEDNVNDLAMAVVAPDFVETDFIKFMPYHRISVNINDEVEIIGWGIINESNKTVSILQYAKAQVNDFRICSAEDAAHEVFVCVRGNIRPYTFPRYGDSGSPGLYKGKIFGVVSMGIPKGDNGALYAKLSYHHHWIERILKKYKYTQLKLRTNEGIRHSGPIWIVAWFFCVFSIIE
ncbi:unnamed protein product [Hermetia illucens]|uniref:Peptidase S1 domain-containing protein n=1 Tax=Hermetia illucens TaxID=343691 RepID=A0A7R8UGQ3_HERIL|nr:unnamed protein product [Hermetia illucens]